MLNIQRGALIRRLWAERWPSYLATIERNATFFETDSIAHQVYKQAMRLHCLREITAVVKK